MTERVNPLTHCVTCGAELTIDKKRGCKVCRLCHPEPVAAPVPPPKAKAFLDVKLTEKRVSELIREIVPDMIREELENWHVQKPPVTKKEIKELTWRQEAKVLGIPLHKTTGGGVRKKVDVLADIELRKGADNGKETKKEADQEAA